MGLKKQASCILMRAMKVFRLDRYISDSLYLKLLYRRVLDKRLDINHPSSFNEKLQWLKLYDRRPEYTRLVDKYEVKKYVKEILGEEIIIPTIGVWDSVDDIPFEKLPNQYVIKCTHDCGSICICRNKETFDVKKTKRKLSEGLKKNLFYSGREWPYKNVKPRIIVEKYLRECNSVQNDLRDYKFMCFNGKVKCSFVCSDRFNNDGLKVTFFDRDWKKMPFERHFPSADYDIAPPVSYKRMIDMSEELSKGIPFVRVDFYEVDGKPYFGEMTFFPGNGIEEFEPDEWDLIMGSWIDLSDIQKV